MQSELSDYKDSSEYEITEEESEDDCNSWVTDQAETHLGLAVIVDVIDTESSTMSVNEFA